MDAGGAALLPGLHDHHMHLMAFAAALDSLSCGPPEVQTAEQLARQLKAENAGTGWLRGIGYHPCVAGELDRDWLDHHIPDRPVRIQHRGGRLWVLNSRALAELWVTEQDRPPGLQWAGGRATGRLYEEDAWLRSRIPRPLPDLARASALLASYGITGITDTTPTNGPAEWELFASAQRQGKLLQRVRMMGGAGLQQAEDNPLLQRGERKFHLLESRLPEFDELCAQVRAAHADHRAAAFHCVTLSELVFALNALETTGVRRGDRIEHASVCSPDQVEQIRRLGLRVVTQPHFIAERGDQYRADVDPAEQPWLYRAASLLRAGIPLAAGSDAPFGGADPWRSMRAAVERRTAGGAVMGPDEAITPEQALGLFLSPLDAPGLGNGRIAPGAPADLCLLQEPWEAARGDPNSRRVRYVWRGGDLVYGVG